MHILVPLSLLLCLFSPCVDGFARWMLKDFCSRELTVGEIIMGDEVMLSHERHVLVHKHSYNEKGDKVLLPLDLTHSNATYSPEDELHISLNDTRGQFVFEITPATPSSSAQSAWFIDGGCKGQHRQDKQHSVLVLPQDGSDILLKAAWATGHVQVAVSPPITLKYDGPPLPAQQLRGGIPTLASLKAPSPASTTSDGIFGMGGYLWLIMAAVVLYVAYTFVYRKGQLKKT